MQITSEGPTRITKATIEAAWKRRKPDNRLIVRDQECRGLALIVNGTTMAWSFAYRPRGTDPLTGKRYPNRAVTIGNPASHAVETARTEANRLKGMTAAGADPAVARKEKAAAERRERAVTLGRLVDSYAVAFARRPKRRGTGLPSSDYVGEDIAQLRMALRDMEIEDRPARHLTTADVRKLIDNKTAAKNVRGRFAALSKFLDWCQEEGHIDANPCVLVGRSRRPRAPQARAHYLRPDDLARLWTAAGDMPEPVWRDLIRFLIAMPCRRTEAAEMRWEHVDLGKAEWCQPGHMTKNGDPHRLFLHPLALEVLRARHEATKGAGLVFPAPRSGGTIDSFTRLKTRLGKATGLTTWTFHDFRRSFATALGEAGISETVADAVLNHRQAATRGGVLGVYQRAVRWPEQVRAMEGWARLLSAAIKGDASNQAEVIDLSKRRA
jgi:integrase